MLWGDHHPLLRRTREPLSPRGLMRTEERGLHRSELIAIVAMDRDRGMIRRNLDSDRDHSHSSGRTRILSGHHSLRGRIEEDTRIVEDPVRAFAHAVSGLIRDSLVMGFRFAISASSRDIGRLIVPAFSRIVLQLHHRSVLFQLHLSGPLCLLLLHHHLMVDALRPTYT